ncbi:MAG: S-layer homology domain-containing protein [Oscillospiraceae bacterium]|nr:S-layer homology domain-containing protein [Oscillospiraceae bacterium]
MQKHIRRGICAFLMTCVMLCAIPNASATRFSDVPASHWAAADIELCADLGFINGVTPTLFGLGQPLSRAACVVILERFFQWPSADPDNLSYQDIDPTRWYAPALAAAYRQGVVTDQSRLFRPDEPVTRGELAVMLVRALGYQTLSGLAGHSAFADVTANAGYIALAHDMGLVNGNGGKFLPDNAATREQAAAILARLYRKLAANPRKIGVISNASGAWYGAGFAATAVRAGQLTGTQDEPIRYSLNASAADSLRTQIADSGSGVLLYLSGEALNWNALNAIADAVQNGYAGLLLELTGASLEASRVQSLKGLLQNKTLHLIVPAPAQTDDDYPYAALCRLADSLTVRVLGQSRLVNGFPTDPVEPLEEVYGALRTLFGPGSALDASKCGLLLSASGSAWTGAVNTGLVSGAAVEELLRSDGVTSYYSERYACAYLRRPADDDTPEQVVWYPDAKSIAARVQLAKLFNLGGLIVANADGLTDSLIRAF